MRFLGLGFIFIAFYAYFRTVQSIWALVAEARKAEPARRFSRFWWLPAWKAHRRAYPVNRLCKQIVLLFAITFSLMLAGMGFIAAAWIGSTS